MIYKARMKRSCFQEQDPREAVVSSILDNNYHQMYELLSVIEWVVKCILISLYARLLKYRPTTVQSIQALRVTFSNGCKAYL